MRAVEDDIPEIFLSVASLFKARNQDPIWNKYPRYLEDSLDSFLIFIEGYAFERQGRNPSYPHAAVEVLCRNKDYIQRKDFPKIIWKDFSKSLKNEKLNKKVNPLFHTENQCCCIWCKMSPGNIILSSKDAIVKGQVKEAWEQIKSIRGIGSKIASLFLRDISVRFELTPPKKDRWLLQPIDIWVRRAVSLIKKWKKMDDEKVAKWLVDNSKNPEVTNQGIWYFCTQIAKSEFRLSKCIKNSDDAQKLYHEHIAILKAAIQMQKVGI